MTKALLDANFLVLPFQHSVDVFAELERLLGDVDVYTLNRTYNEALDLEDGKYRQQVERLVAEKNLTVISRASDATVDTVLVELAGEYVVCTNDRELRRRLSQQQLPHVYLRQRSYLEGENLDASLPF
ncbi:MAG: PIN domain-containing protein [Candidatus Nanohaloarchaea archaeon]